MANSNNKVKKFGHPGKKARSARYQGKGLQVDSSALQTIRELLGKRLRRRDLLIEHLHLIQDRFRCLSPSHLAALAEEMKLSLAEVYEVATFYAHFDVMDNDSALIPPITIRVCDSLSCELQGSTALYEKIANGTDKKLIRVLRAPCMGRCENAPIAEVGHRHIHQATAETVCNAANNGMTAPIIPPYIELEEYIKNGGYSTLKACINGSIGVDNVIETMEKSALKGLGGAGFPAGKKWRFVKSEKGPRFLAVNADEGEPGTFKDRYYIERDPHRFIEGMLIAAHVVSVEECFIYLRDEYPGIHQKMSKSH